jgi:hypothetical protein
MRVPEGCALQRPLLFCYHVVMSNRVEYLFASTVTIADQAARKQGWRPRGRADWLKPDGTIVYFICLTEQLAIVPPGATVHVVGKPPAELGRLKRICTLAALAV